MAALDLPRLRAAFVDLAVDGDPAHNEREALIARAIAMIQADGKAALATGYLGVKNYAHFGDQESSHPYGFGPRHGSIVFSIGRTRPADKVILGADHIYALEAYRDFGIVELPFNLISELAAAAGYSVTNGCHTKATLNLRQALRLNTFAKALINTLGVVLSHANPPPA